MILRLDTPPDPGPDIEGLILEETAYGTPPVAGPPAPSLTLVLDGLLVETTDAEVTPVAPLAVAIHTGTNGTSLLRRSGVPGVTRCFELRLTGGWASRLRDSTAALRGTSAYFNAGRINSLMGQIHVEAVRPGVASSLAISGLTLTLFAELGRMAATESASRPMQSWLRRAVALVHQRYREPLRMSELAREVGVHPVHLSRAFRRAFGVTMTEYVRDLRIHVAAEALVAGPEPLPRIARSVGYQNLGHFTRSFKRATGVTPGAYRGRRRR